MATKLIAAGVVLQMNMCLHIDNYISLKLQFDKTVL